MNAPVVRVPFRPSPHPLGATLPALYLDDVFAQNLCASQSTMSGGAVRGSR